MIVPAFVIRKKVDIKKGDIMSTVSEEIRVSPGVSIEVDGKKVLVKGPKGEVQRNLSHISAIEVKKSGDKLTIRPLLNRKHYRSLATTLKTEINNMILGVTKGFTYKLKVAHSHFPITVKADKGKRLVLIENFIGERTPRIASIEGNVEVTVKGDEVLVSGADKEEVGQTTANIRKTCKIKDKDPRVFQDGIYLSEMYCGDELLKKI